MKARRVAKFLTALAGAGGQILALGLVDGDARGWLTVAISMVTAAAVYLVPNAEAATPTSDARG